MSTKTFTKKYAAHELRLLDFPTKSDRVGKELRKLELYLLDDRPILFVGETGVGKTGLAQAAHFASPRREFTFRDRCVGEMERTLLRSELFGHVRGAFTGAMIDRNGLFRTAKGGTVFLDEIADLRRWDQAALLRAIEYRRVQPVGSDESFAIDVRFFFATNVPIEVMLANPSRWRRDFVMRLGQAVIHVLPLRERLEDLEDLAKGMVKKHCEVRTQPLKGIPKETLTELMKRSWAMGNLRELDECLRVAVARSEGPWVRPESLPPEVKLEAVPAPIRPLRMVERELALQALAACGNNLTLAANSLGIERSTLRRILNRR